MSERVQALWFDSRGYGPDELALELSPFPSEKDGAIPASLGIRVRAGAIVIGAVGMLDGGFHLSRQDAAELHRQIGEWLESLQ